MRTRDLSWIAVKTFYFFIYTRYARDVFKRSCGKDRNSRLDTVRIITSEIFSNAINELRGIINRASLGLSEEVLKRADELSIWKMVSENEGKPRGKTLEAIAAIVLKRLSQSINLFCCNESYTDSSNICIELILNFRAMIFEYFQV